MKRKFPCYGEQKCKIQTCQNGGYYSVKEQILCKVHSRKFVYRQELQHDKKRLAQLRAEVQKIHHESVEKAASTNRNQKQKGTVILTKLRMMRNPALQSGFLQVWPNNKHQNKPGYGCAALSPMRLPAWQHGEHILVDPQGKVYDAKNTTETEKKELQLKLMPLPPAQNIENYHQFAKVFQRDVCEKESESESVDPKKTNQAVKPEFWNMLKLAYQDVIPHRHKYPDIQQKNKNIPLFSLRCDSQGSWFRYTYVESRYFYCKMYEKEAVKTREFQELKEKIQKGYNLEILGFDAFPLTQSLLEHYVDDSRPFGHELVLFTLLTVDQPQEYPWNIFFTTNRLVYP